MAWYRTGTVTVTTGSATIVGAGTDFVSNAVMGDGFRGPDGRTCEIARIVSATELTLAEGYAGPSAGGQPYSIQPTQSYLRDLAQSAATLLATFGTVRDGIGQGLIGDGSLAAPGLRFVADQDSGLYRAGTNVVGIAAGGVSSATFDAGGVNLPAGKSFGHLPNTENFLLYGKPVAHYGMTVGFDLGTSSPATVIMGHGGVLLGSDSRERMRIDAGGKLLVGATDHVGTGHKIARAVGLNGRNDVLSLHTAAGSSICTFFGVSGALGSPTSTAMDLATDANTGRSLNAGGTINASGADYAEYMTKAASCGTIDAGDVCGVDVDGKLTRTWADALSFVVKSTDPAYVGGDTWAAGMAPRPEQPGTEPIEPAAPPARPDDEGELEAWTAVLEAYPAALAAWRAEHAAWEAATAAYQRDLAMWDAELEAERVKVDRIAFCGQVPVNVTGEFAVGDYLIAAPAGAGIKAVAIATGEISFDQYRRRLGKVWAIRDGRAWIDVQHG